MAYLFFRASGLVWFNFFDSGIERPHGVLFVHRCGFGVV